MSGTGWLPGPVGQLFGTEATAEESYGVLTVDVPPATWVSALRTARDELGCTYFDWLSAVDEPGTGFRVSAHVVALAPVRRLLVRTTVPHAAPVLPSAVEVYAGAAWHERETHEMFGVVFDGHPALVHLLLPDTFEGHPLRKDFVLAARVAKAWPGAKEPGESDHGGPKRRQMLPPGVPDPDEWGPMKGRLPAAPARPARGAGRAAGERPVRRTRTAAEGSAGQAATAATTTGAAAPTEPAVAPGAGSGSARPRRMRSASQGSASQRTPAPGTEDAPPETGGTRADAAAIADTAGAAPGTGAADSGVAEGQAGAEEQAGAERTAQRRTPAGDAPAAHEQPGTRAEGPTPSTPARARRARSASGGSASQRARAAAAPGEPGSPTPPTAPRTSDAPWHHARPAFDDDEPGPQPERTPEHTAPETDTGIDPAAGTGTGTGIDVAAGIGADVGIGGDAGIGADTGPDAADRRPETPGEELPAHDDLRGGPQ